MGDDLSKQEVIKRLCRITEKVCKEKFEYEIPADCFCGSNSLSGAASRYRFDEQILKFIEDAVQEKIGR